MDTERTHEILKSIWADPRGRELLEGMEQRARTEQMDAPDAIAEVAVRLGYELSPADVRELMEQEDAQRKARTDEAASLVKLSDDELDDVAGGFWHFDTPKGTCNRLQHSNNRKPGCKEDFTDDDCYVNDACEWYAVNYFDCEGTYHGEFVVCMITDFKWHDLPFCTGLTN